MENTKKLLLNSNNTFKREYEETNDILYAIKALNEIVRPNPIYPKDFIKCDVEEIKWPVIALNKYFKLTLHKKWKKFQIGCIANLLVDEGYSVNKTKECLSKWFKCSNTYVREAYYEVRNPYKSTFGFLLISYDDIMELITSSGKIPNGYEEWLDSLNKQLKLHHVLVTDNIGTFKMPKAK